MSSLHSDIPKISAHLLRSQRIIRTKSKNISKKVFRYNHFIRSPQVNVIGPNGEQFGVLSLTEALQKAQFLELDLVEVSPVAQPPVCKIMDYGKFIYEQGKNQRKKKAKSKKTEIKGLRLTLKMGEHDKDIRRNQARKFFEDGNKVKIEMILRGRERAHLSNAVGMIDAFISSLGSGVSKEGKTAAQGGRLSVIVYKK